jgi:hypothetical protein
MMQVSALAIVICALAALVLPRLGIFVPGWRTAKRGWRVRLVTPGRWAYEERRKGRWEGIPFEEVADINQAPFVVFAPSVGTWRTFPPWVQGRRMEILGRVRSELTIHKYVIEGLDVAETEPVPALPTIDRISYGGP